jgi:hypothetical protein
VKVDRCRLTLAVLSVAGKMLGEAGVELFRNGDYAAALEKFRQARSLANVPTLVLRVARCLDKLGRLLEAKQAYEDAVALELEPGALAAQKTAQDDARRELAALVARIPTLSIVIKGADGSEIKVTVDGQPVPAVELKRRAVDPGNHRVEGQRSEEKVVVETAAAEGQSVQVVLGFGSRSGTGAIEPAAPPLPPPPRTGDQGARSSRDILAFTALGLGGAGLGVGVITGVLALGNQSKLAEDCPTDSTCPKDLESVIKSYDARRAASMIGFGVGVLGAGAGIALLLTAPRAKPTAAARVEPWIGPGFIGAKGRF